ncbi:LysR family transcriptional regulator [Klebsiella variicola]|nr:LysR family transcriptional regulator [Klebsiella variicola]
MRHGILDFAGWRRTPYPAYKPKSPRVLGLLKLPVLAASTSLRRSRQAGAARMDAG